MYRIIHVTDGHHNHPVLDITQSFNDLITLIKSTGNPETIDALIYTGDITDDVVHVNTIEYLDLQASYFKLCRFCKKYNIAFILLDGTYTHDYHQGRMLIEIAKEVGCRFKFIDKVEIFNFDGFTFLGIPDNIAGGCALVEKSVRVMLKEQGITNVDITLTHGMYDYMMNAGLLHIEDYHKANYYCSITKHVILNGHNHTPSTYKHLNNTGSLFRTRHGEEHDKGFLEVLIDGDDVRLKRHVNPYTILFKTHELNSTTEQEAIEEIANVIETTDRLSESHLKVKFNKDMVINFVVDELRSRYPLLKLKAEPFKEKKKDVGDVSKGVTKIKTIPITPNTIVDLITDKLNKMNVEVDKVLPTFIEIKNEVK